MIKRVVFILLLLNLLIVGAVLAQAGETSIAPPDALWAQIPLAGAICARGTPYSFFVHEGDPDKLMVYFQGGGACWNAATCKPGGTFDDSVEADELDRYGGIFDFDNPQNPVADYSIVVVPYCTGDVHTGAATREYSLGETDITLHFDGFANAQAVLEWVYARYETPDQLIVTGSSAGAYGAVFNAPYLLAHYPDANATVFGDAGIGVVPAEWDGFSTWGTAANLAPEQEIASTADSTAFLNSLYRSAARAYPNAQFAEYTSYGDAVQTGFYILMGGAREDWVMGLETSFTELGQLENFHSYVGWGGTHTALATPLFYHMQVDGVAFRNWFADLIDGAPVDNVKCDDCITPELADG